MAPAISIFLLGERRESSTRAADHLTVCRRRALVRRALAPTHDADRRSTDEQQKRDAAHCAAHNGASGQRRFARLCANVESVATTERRTSTLASLAVGAVEESTVVKESTIVDDVDVESLDKVAVDLDVDASELSTDVVNVAVTDVVDVANVADDVDDERLLAVVVREQLHRAATTSQKKSTTKLSVKLGRDGHVAQTFKIQEKKRKGRKRRFSDRGKRRSSTHTTLNC